MKMRGSNLKEQEQKQEQKGTAVKKKRRKRGIWRSKKAVVLFVVLLILIIAGLSFFLAGNKKEEESVDAKNIGTVQRGEITSELTSSGALAAKDSYDITSLVSGEIITADFEEGDQVEKGQVLYTIDPTDINQELGTAEKNVESAKKDLEDAEKSYNDAVRDYNNGVYLSKDSGYIKDLKLKEGDKVGGQSAAELATLYDDRTMELRLPFLNAEADALPIGADVVVTVNDTGEQLPGKVTEKSQLEETLSGGTLVKYVTVIVSNPGGLTTADTGSVQCGDIYSAADGTFAAYMEKTLSYDLSDTVEVSAVLVTEGQYVTAGTPLFSIDAEDLSEVLRTYEKKVDTAQTALSSAEDKLVQLQENLDEYTITAPISGQVITKTSKAGDKLNAGGNNTTAMATIYDLSELTFDMSIDEIDISKVAVGQEVEVTADAFEGKEFTGHVTNVSMNASNSDGVTTYPVTVKMDTELSTDGESKLLPGMNIDGTIILDKAENVLYIPSNALQRGDIVYVRDTSLTEEQKAQSGSNSGMNGALPGDDKAVEAKPEDGAGSKEQAEAGKMPQGIGIPEGFTPVKVETGLVTDDYVEIKSGLSEGQEVYVKESESSQSGMFFMGGPGGMGAPGGMGGPGGGGPRG